VKASRAAAALGLERNVAVLSATIFGLALGEELWQAYMPAYLAALGASGIAVGLFGSLRDLLDSLYQYPGGRIADRIGRRRALLLFTSVATGGYTIYALAPGWPFLFAGLFGVMAWKAGAFATTFAIIGDSLPAERRAIAFSVQSILIRVPRVIAAPLGGLAIATLGITGGIRLCFVLTIALAVIVLAVQLGAMRQPPDASRPDPGRAPAAVRPMPVPLRRLLLADCLVRIGEGLAASFIVLYLMQDRGVTAAEYGMFYALQQVVALLFYLPGGRIADRTGRAPMIALTLLFFALFPLAVQFAATQSGLLAAFVIGGLKEIGEPARKSLIVDLAPEDRRAATIGLYYAIRNFLVVPAGLAGGLLWERAHHLPLNAGFAVGLLGVIVFVALRPR
jgi:MFS family permease